MATTSYDAIVVGARCAGSPTAMLLARRGYKVLLVDRARFPSDTVSTHLIHPPGVAAMERWGLLDRLLATGCPPIDTYRFDFGPITIFGSPAADGSPVAYAPRRTVLDKLLVDAADEAGAEVREEFAVEELVIEEGLVAGVRGHGKDGRTITERARAVVGADGRRSFVAKAVNPERYHEKPPLQASYYTYVSDLPMNGHFETYLRPGRGFAAWPTNDDLTLVIVAWPYAEFDTNRKDIEGNVLRTIELVPEFADRFRAGTRTAPLVGMFVSNFFRKPFGPGWVLVGDAGYDKDFITALGITDAFRDAELCAAALDESFSGARAYDVAMHDYQSIRDEESLPFYEFTAQIATLQPPPLELQQLLGAVSGNQTSMDQFARVAAAVTSPTDFFSEENIGRIFEAAEQRPST